MAKSWRRAAAERQVPMIEQCRFGERSQMRSRCAFGSGRAGATRPNPGKGRVPVSNLDVRARTARALRTPSLYPRKYNDHRRKAVSVKRPPFIQGAGTEILRGGISPVIATDVEFRGIAVPNVRPSGSAFGATGRDPLTLMPRDILGTCATSRAPFRSRELFRDLCAGRGRPAALKSFQHSSRSRGAARL